MVRPRVPMPVLVIATLSGCWDIRDYSIGSAEGSLVQFFGDPLACFCGLELAASERKVQYLCGPEAEKEKAIGYDLTFYTPLPASANQRGKAFTEVQLGNTAWPSSGFGTAAAEMEYGSEEFGNPDLDEDTQVSKYREVIIWGLDVPAQRICSALDASACMDLPAGRATELRFTCKVMSR